MLIPRSSETFELRASENQTPQLIRCAKTDPQRIITYDPDHRPRSPAGAVALVDDSLRQAELMRRRHRRVPLPRSGFAGFRFPPEVIVLAVR